MNREEIVAKLESEYLEATWSALQPHTARDALIVVSRSLSLAEVGAAIALDDTAMVSGWMQAQMLCKPSPEQCKEWAGTPRKLFQMVIVQPFVLVHEMTPEEEDLIFEATKPN